MKQIETQKSAIRDYLLLGLSLDSFEAIKKFGCTKLSTRVGELEKEGKLPVVHRNWKDVRTRYDRTKVRVYSIKPFVKPKTKSL